MPKNETVLICVKLSNEEFGDVAERLRCFEIQDAVDAALRGRPELGMFDWHRFESGLFTMFLFGPDAASLYAAVAPALASFELRPGSHAIVRADRDGYGPRVELGPPTTR